MKVMLGAFLATLLIAFVAFYGLGEIGFTSAKQQASETVRLD